jgi:hypothetical protein
VIDGQSVKLQKFGFGNLGHRPTLSPGHSLGIVSATSSADNAIADALSRNLDTPNTVRFGRPCRDEFDALGVMADHPIELATGRLRPRPGRGPMPTIKLHGASC